MKITTTTTHPPKAIITRQTSKIPHIILLLFLLLLPSISNVNFVIAVSSAAPPNNNNNPSQFSIQSSSVTNNDNIRSSVLDNGGSSGGDDDPYAMRPEVSSPGGMMGEYYGEADRETVEDRVASWRQYQLDQYNQQTPLQQSSPTDSQGRMKLLANVSRTSISLFFFILMWRSVHHYELADQAFSSSSSSSISPLRLITVVPIVALFVGNMAGCVASVTSPSGSAKKRMKAILNLNKVVEGVLFLYNLGRLTLFNGSLVPREIYVGRVVSNFVFIVQCQLFTKVNWNAAQISSDLQSPSSTSSSSYDTSAPQSEYPPYEQQGMYGQQQQQQQQSSDGNGWS